LIIEETEIPLLG